MQGCCDFKKRHSIIEKWIKGSLFTIAYPKNQLFWFLSEFYYERKIIFVRSRTLSEVKTQGSCLQFHFSTIERLLYQVSLLQTSLIKSHIIGPIFSPILDSMVKTIHPRGEFGHKFWKALEIWHILKFMHDVFNVGHFQGAFTNGFFFLLNS